MSEEPVTGPDLAPAPSSSVEVTIPSEHQFALASQGNDAGPIGKILVQVRDIMVGNGWIAPPLEAAK